MPTQSALRELPPAPSFLSTRQGKLTLAFLCMVGFLDFVDASIVNVALPSIRRDLHFSVQSLQWVLSAYLLTYGGFMLLGGRAADLLGRRRILTAGIIVFAFSSLTGGVAQDPAMLVTARLVQGIGAAMMVPAALSILTTTFSEGTDRHKALGAWGGIAGLASAMGVFLGGVLTEEASWRWVFWVNLPVSALLLIATFRMVSGERDATRTRNFDSLGAFLVTGGMLLLVYALVKAPDHRHRCPDFGRRHLLAVTHPRARLLPREPPARPHDHVVRPRLRLRRRQHRRERRRTAGQSRSRGSAREHVDLGRRRFRTRDLLRHRNLPHQPPARARRPVHRRRVPRHDRKPIRRLTPRCRRRSLHPRRSQHLAHASAWEDDLGQRGRRPLPARRRPGRGDPGRRPRLLRARREPLARRRPHPVHGARRHPSGRQRRELRRLWRARQRRAVRSGAFACGRRELTRIPSPRPGDCGRGVAQK